MRKLEELKSAYGAATPGEWEESVAGYGLIYGEDEDGAYLVCDVVRDPDHAVNEQDSHNAHFITLAHNLMPQLLQAMELVQEISNLSDTTTCVCAKAWAEEAREIMGELK